MRFPALAGVTGLLASAWLGGEAACAPGGSDPVSGRWSAALEIPAGEVAFGLDLRLAGGAITGSILNGDEAQALSGGSFDGQVLELRLDYYDGRITARFADAARTALIGEYARQTRDGIGRYAFKASRAEPQVARAGGASAALGDAALSGDWVFTIRQDGKPPELNEAWFAVAPLEPGRAAISGTLIPVSGDYGLLHGSLAQRAGEPTAFRMSRFDGIHVTLLRGELRADGTLVGELASGQSYRAPFTAVRKAPSAARPDEAYAMTSMKDPSEPLVFSVPDGDGRPVSLADARYRGKVVIVDLMGTWCPNCHDEAPLLVELDRKYREQGLEVVMLAYEYTPDAVRSQRQIAIFREKYGIEFPILLAGVLGDVERTLPQLAGFGAYPTTLFVGRDGRVRRIHAGFAGPATGARFPALKQELESLVRDLLMEKP